MPMHPSPRADTAREEPSVRSCIRTPSVVTRPFRPTRAPGAESAVFADVLVPQVRMRGDELRHQGDTVEVVGDDHLDPSATEQVLAAYERAVLPHDDARDAVEQDRAGAHVAR